MTKAELVAKLAEETKVTKKVAGQMLDFSGEDFAGRPEESREDTDRRFRYLCGCPPKGTQWCQSSNESQNKDSGHQGS